MIALTDRFGPWADDIDQAERLARLRSMRAIVRLATGPRGEALANELHRAERDASRLPFALAALDHLAHSTGARSSPATPPCTAPRPRPAPHDAT